MLEDEARRRNLSPRTIETYIFCTRKFLKWYSNDINKVKKTDIKEFMTYLINKKLTGSTLNVYVSALKFLLEEVIYSRVMLKVKYPKTPKTIPIFLTKEETTRLINSIKNPKHKLIVEMMYSAGLRVSEVTNINIQDINLNAKIGYVRKGKGNKDRIFIIADKLVEKIGKYALILNINEGCLFKGRNGKLSIRTIQEIVKKAAKKAGINKNVHCHTLRHSFATHLIENGYDVASVQSLLGHTSAKTTMIYVHMANPKIINVKSPYDSI